MSIIDIVRHAHPMKLKDGKRHVWPTLASMVYLDDGTTPMTGEDGLLNADKALDSDKLGGKTIEDILLAIQPVGSIVIRGDEVNPQTIYGGTWEKIAQGRTLLGAGANEANTDTTYGSLAAGTVNRSLGERGGEATHALTEPEMPRHYHASGSKNVNGNIGYQDPNGDNTGGTAFTLGWGDVSSRTDLGICVEYAGGSAAHNNMTPYLAVNIWQRMA